tara:strand:+ start:17876 stop:18277 length:402 start_codon:yes stop_codon:yes gene_type:complete
MFKVKFNPKRQQDLEREAQALKDLLTQKPIQNTVQPMEIVEDSPVKPAKFRFKFEPVLAKPVRPKPVPAKPAKPKPVPIKKVLCDYSEFDIVLNKRFFYCDCNVCRHRRYCFAKHRTEMTTKCGKKYKSTYWG